MTVSVRSNWTPVRRELLRLEYLPGDDATPLEEALAAVFDQTLAIVHVITGSLKNSGTTTSKLTEDEWVGEMTFGGPSPGAINDPVTYAGYEIARGGSHDFMDQAVAFGSPLFEQATADVLQGRR